MNLGPLMKFNAAASAAHAEYHRVIEPLKAEGKRLLEESERLMRKKVAVIALLEVAELEQMRAIFEAHPDIPQGASISIDCDGDGYRIAYAPQVAKQPEWASEMQREIEGRA